MYNVTFGGWSTVHLAELLTFSSFARTSFQIWGVYAQRPYGIVVFPGYRVPSMLDQTSKDALWLEGEIREPVVMWDGYCPVALHEVILECVDPGRESAHVVVMALDENGVPTGDPIGDPRSSERLARRPMGGRSRTPSEFRAHLKALRAWAQEDGIDWDTIYTYANLDYVGGPETAGPDGGMRVYTHRTLGRAAVRKRDKSLHRPHIKGWPMDGNDGPVWHCRAPRKTQKKA